MLKDLRGNRRHLSIEAVVARRVGRRYFTARTVDHGGGLRSGKP
jgi:hypothetical protein